MYLSVSLTHDLIWSQHHPGQIPVGIKKKWWAHGQWRSLADRWRDHRIVLSYKIIYGLDNISLESVGITKSNYVTYFDIFPVYIEISSVFIAPNTPMPAVFFYNSVNG